MYDLMMESPIAAIFISELQYMLEIHVALEEYYDISFAHNYFHAYNAYNSRIGSNRLF